MNEPNPILESLTHLQKQMNRIERNQAKLSNDFDLFRADNAIVTSRQNSRIEDAKKKQTGRQPLPGQSLFGLSS